MSADGILSVIAEALPLATRFLASLSIALTLTVLIECTAAFILFGVRRPGDLGTLALINVVTNPVLNIMLALTSILTGARSLTEPPLVIALALLELAVVLAEWKLIAWLLPAWKPRALLMALILNGVSLAAGLVLSLTT